jgi:hypothetical protein
MPGFEPRLGAESLNSALDRLVTGYDELLGSRQTLLEGRHIARAFAFESAPEESGAVHRHSASGTNNLNRLDAASPGWSCASRHVRRRAAAGP